MRIYIAMLLCVAGCSAPVVVTTSQPTTNLHLIQQRVTAEGRRQQEVLQCVELQQALKESLDATETIPPCDVTFYYEPVTDKAGSEISRQMCCVVICRFDNSRPQERTVMRAVSDAMQERQLQAESISGVSTGNTVAILLSHITQVPEAGQ